MRAIWIDRRDDPPRELSRRAMERMAHRVSPDATISSLAELPAAIQST